MKHKNTTKAVLIGFSLFTLAGFAPTLNGAGLGTLVLDDVQHDAKAIEIIENSLDAIGGRELIKQAKYISVKGTLSIPAAGIEGTINTYLKAPDQMLVHTNIPMMGEQKQGVNGEVGWSSDPMTGPRILPEDEAKALKKEANPAERLNYKAENPLIEYKGETEFDGMKAHQLRLVDKDGVERIEYYDIEKHYMIGTEAEVPTPMGQVKVISMMREYKELGGVLQPTLIVQKMGPQEFMIRITEVSYDEIDASVFELPAAVVALIKASKKDD